MNKRETCLCLFFPFFIPCAVREQCQQSCFESLSSNLCKLKTTQNNTLGKQWQHCKKKEDSFSVYQNFLKCVFQNVFICKIFIHRALFSDLNTGIISSYIFVHVNCTLHFQIVFCMNTHKRQKYVIYDTHLCMSSCVTSLKCCMGSEDLKVAVSIPKPIYLHNGLNIPLLLWLFWLYSSSLLNAH